MKTIQVYDPALCCSSGVCGVEVDQVLVSFSADVDWAMKNGAQIERFNLAQQPMAFAGNDLVKGFLERAGQEALPLTLRVAAALAAAAAEQQSHGATDAIPRTTATVPLLYRQGRGG